MAVFPTKGVVKKTSTHRVWGAKFSHSIIVCSFSYTGKRRRGEVSQSSRSISLGRLSQNSMIEFSDNCGKIYRGEVSQSSCSIPLGYLSQNVMTEFSNNCGKTHRGEVSHSPLLHPSLSLFTKHKEYNDRILTLLAPPHW